MKKKDLIKAVNILSPSANLTGRATKREILKALLNIEDFMQTYRNVMPGMHEDGIYDDFCESAKNKGLNDYAANLAFAEMFVETYVMAKLECLSHMVK